MSTPKLWRSSTLNRPPGVIEPDVPGQQREGALEEADHRRRILRDVEEAQALALALVPTTAVATADVTVSSSTFVAVPGLSLSWRSPTNGEVEIAGMLGVDEITTGSFSAQITVDAVVVWTATVKNQSSLLLTGTHEGLSSWLLPIGGVERFTARRGIIYTLTAEIAAPGGSYRANTTTSWLKVFLNPSLAT